jgi:hypothetical protein
MQFKVLTKDLQVVSGGVAVSSRAKRFIRNVNGTVRHRTSINKSVKWNQLFTRFDEVARHMLLWVRRSVSAASHDG